MTRQQQIIPKMGAPLRAMTREQIESERRLYQETGYNVTHRARVLGIQRTTLDFHLNSVKGGGRITPRVQRLIDAGNAIMEHLPKDVSSITARAEWCAAKSVYTRRKEK